MDRTTLIRPLRHRDLLGSVVGTSTPGGAAGAAYRYDIYGKATGTSGAISDATISEIGYTGGLNLSGGLVHLKTRQYAPALRRFIQADMVDPLRYTYVRGDPANSTDPSGRCPACIIFIETEAEPLAAEAIDFIEAEAPAVEAEAAKVAETLSETAAAAFEVVKDTAATVAETVEGAVTQAAASIEGTAAQVVNAIQTPYANEVQSVAAEAQTAISSTQGGSMLYRVGELGKSMTGEGQYWSLRNPLSPGYAQGIGLPNVNTNFMMGGTLKTGAQVVTNQAAALGANLGGAIQVVTQPSSVGGLWFHMLDKK